MLGLVKIIYRWPFDWIEGWSMSGSDVIVVNSNFTRSVVRRLFPGLEDLEVVYPCVNTQVKDAMKEAPPGKTEEPLWGGMKTLLSINRFERKKDIELAIRAFNALKKEERRNCRLVIAGIFPQFAHRLRTVLTTSQEATIGGLQKT
jgi:alpha-1,3/alpha-1,6-mannosyltransferase